jgi:hypothetical protein
VPCSINDAVGELMLIIPAHICARRRSSPETVARSVIDRLSKSLVIRDGVIVSIDPPRQAKSETGQCVLNMLKAEGKVYQVQTGYSESTWRSYSHHLVKIGWCERGANGALLWKGPADASWKTITAMHQGKLICHRQG